MKILYADASVKLKSKRADQAAIAYAFYEKNNNENWSLVKNEAIAIDNGSSSNSAESVAIRVALSSDESVEDADKIAVFSDSKSNLDTIHGRIAESIDKRQLFDAIQDYPTKIDFFFKSKVIATTERTIS